ncbi:hypothetical protein Agub_g1173, partial [Astrephomene gubernaculifera]
RRGTVSEGGDRAGATDVELGSGGEGEAADSDAGSGVLRSQSRHEEEERGRRQRRSQRWQSRQQQQRQQQDELPDEPMAPLSHLAEAINAVRPRVQVARFGHCSVAEAMRRELQARRERQLQKTRQLMDQLRNQPFEQLWPASSGAATATATAAAVGPASHGGATGPAVAVPPAEAASQLRRQRLQELGRRRRRWSGTAQEAEQQAQAASAVPAGASMSRAQVAGAKEEEEEKEQRSELAVSSATGNQSGDEGRGGCEERRHVRLDGGRESDGSSPGASPPEQLSTAGEQGGGTTSPPPQSSPEQPPPGAAAPDSPPRPAAATAAPPAAQSTAAEQEPCQSPRQERQPAMSTPSSHPAPAAPGNTAAITSSAVAPPAPTTAAAAAVAVAVSPQRPLPHYLAATRQTLSALEATLRDGVAAELQGQQPATAASDPRVTAAVMPSYALVQKRAPVTTFSPARTVAPSPRYSREPGPGHYDPQLADTALSRMARSPAPFFGGARRSVVVSSSHGGEAADGGSPTHAGASSAAAASAAAEVAWLYRDPAAALDYTKRRVPAAVILPAPSAMQRRQGELEGEGADEGTAVGLHQPTQELVLDVRFTLVEPRVRGTPIMRRPQPAPAAVVEDEYGQPLERLIADPWAIDLAIRRRRPAWGFPAVGHVDILPKSPVGRDLLDLRPVYDLVERRVAGAPDFSRAQERYAGEEERLRQLRRQPAAGDYEVELAWAYLCRRAPQVLMRLAAPRWPPPRPSEQDTDAAGAAASPHIGADPDPDADADPDMQRRQRGAALLELSAALDCIRPRPPAWTFAPIVRVVRRDGGGRRDRGAFGPLLSFDVRLSLVRRRLPGALPFGAGPPRVGLLDPRALAAVRHLAPGTYEVELAWRAAQPAPRATDFARGTGHVLDADEPPPPDDGGDLPYGARLVLDAAAAKDAVLARRSRGVGPRMAVALGREEAQALDPPGSYQYTLNLPLPDPDLDLPTRPRPRAVVLHDDAPGHQPPAPEPSAHEALRGPGAYSPEELAVAGHHPTAPAVDFGRAAGRDAGAEGNNEDALEGNRLVLSPHTALDYVRPRPPAAIMQPPHATADEVAAAANAEMPYFHAVYDTAAGVELQHPRPVGVPDFGAGAGRDLPMPWPAGIDPPEAPYNRTAAAMLGPDDVALCRLAGFRRAPGAPDFGVMQPRMPPTAVNMDGQRLDLDPDAVLDRLRHMPPRPADMTRAQGRADPLAAGGWLGGPDPDLTAWLDYRPRPDAVRRHLVAPLAVPLGRQIGRAQAQRADPWVGDDATGDLDAGVYNVRYRLVRRSAPAIDFSRAAAVDHTGLAPGALPSDPDAGNTLLLQPRQPEGWRPALHPGEPGKQPFGRGEGRWEQPGADPAYRLLAAVGDEGGALLLRHSADDLAALRRRATAANAPAAAWGWMTARRDAQVMQPDPSQPPPPPPRAPAVPRVGTLLVQRLPPRDAELEVIKANPPNDPRVVAIRRRDRVLQRMVDKIKAQRAAVADI